MKVTSNKGETKKRKRDDGQEGTSESSKKAKVHAQRKFAQGATFNSSVITPIKDKVRPAASAPASGPMLTNKCPNTEDFLTFLCFRRTSILPAKLDFFKDGLSSKPETTVKPEKTTTGRKSNIDHSEKHAHKKHEKVNEKKKVETHSVQALRKKYKEQRLAKQKVTNVTKLAQKVKGKNMVRTRSSTAVSEPAATLKKKLAPTNETGTLGGLRSGLKRVQAIPRKQGKPVGKPKHFRSGLRSGSILSKSSKPSHLNKSTLGKKLERDVKKTKTVISEKKDVVGKVKKGEGFSDFSSDDNEPLSAAKKTVVKKTVKKLPVAVGHGKKPFVKTRAQVHGMESTKTAIRPTRKTKEAAAIYMEMITKKLVSPEKSGDDDVSSVDSFPELPNAKRNAQRETEIKAKAQALKKAELKQSIENINEAQKSPAKKADQKEETKISKDEMNKKKELKGIAAKPETFNKKLNRRSLKEEPQNNEENNEELKADAESKMLKDNVGSKKGKDDTSSKKIKEESENKKVKDDNSSKKVKNDVRMKKKMKDVQNPRPSTRSMGGEMLELPLKKPKLSLNKETTPKTGKGGEQKLNEKNLLNPKKTKDKVSKGKTGEESVLAPNKNLKKDAEKSETEIKEREITKDISPKRGRKENSVKETEKRTEKVVENKKLENEKPNETKKIEKEKLSEIKKVEKEKSSEVKKLEKEKHSESKRVEKEKHGESKKVEKEKSNETRKIEEEKHSETKKLEKEKPSETKKLQKEKPNEMKKLDKEKSSETKKLEKEKLSETKKPEKEKLSETKKSEKERPSEMKKLEKDKPGETKKSEKEKPNETKKLEKEKPSEIKKSEKEKPSDTKKLEKEKPSEMKKLEKEKPNEMKKLDKEKPSETKKLDKEKPSEMKKLEKEKPGETKKPEKEKPCEMKKLDKEKPIEMKKPEKEKTNEMKKLDKEKTSETKKLEKEKPNEMKKLEKEKAGETKKSEKEKPNEMKKPDKEKTSETKKLEKEKPGETKKSEKEKTSETKKSEKEKPNEMKKLDKEKPIEMKKPEKEKTSEAKKSEKEKPNEMKKLDKEKTSETKKLEKEKPTEMKKLEKEKPSEMKKSEKEKISETKKLEKEKISETKKLEKEKGSEMKKLEKEKNSETKKLEKEKGSETKKLEKEKGSETKKLEKEKPVETKKMEQEKPTESKKMEKEKSVESKKSDREKPSGTKQMEKEKADREKNSETKTERKSSRKAVKKVEEPVSLLSKRPTRKCSTADKIWIDIDGFTSDEDDFLDLSPIIDVNITPAKSLITHKEKVTEKSVRKEKQKKEDKESKEDLKKPESKSVKTEKKKSESELKDNETSFTKIEENKFKAEKDVGRESEKEIKNLLSQRKNNLDGGQETILTKDEKGSEQKITTKEVETLKSFEAKSENKKSPGRKPKKKSEDIKSAKKREYKPKLEVSLDSPESEEVKRKRPVRQCSTGEKRWIESDSDSFSYYESSEDDDLPILEFSNRKRGTSSPKGASCPKVAKKESKPLKSVPEEVSTKDEKCFENFSDSDEEPLKKKANVEEAIMQIVGASLEDSPKSSLAESKVVREMPALHPLKKLTVETPVKRPEGDIVPLGFQAPALPVPQVCEPKVLAHDVKTYDTFGMQPLQPLVPTVHGHGIQPLLPQVHAMQPLSPPIHSMPSFQPQVQVVQGQGVHLGSNITTMVPNRMNVLIHSVQKDRLPETSDFSNNVKVTFETAPTAPVPLPNPIPTTQIPCTYQIEPMNFPPPREPISTHGLDLLSEVALPTTPHSKLNSQTERIEKWLNDSLVVEQKKRFVVYENQDPKVGTSARPNKHAVEPDYFYGKPVPGPIKETVSSHPEFVKFGQMELLESQRLLKKNVFSAEPKQEANKTEQAVTTPKKALTSVQDLLKLQKERKEVAKTSPDNSPHLKNCKCNNCVVKKGWFKNKPQPRTEQQKSPVIEDSEEAAKPFESLTKAFTKVTGEGTGSKMSVSVAPMVAFSKQEGSDKKMVQQRKMSFLERMKERERKEAAAKLSANAFSPNNERSVYAFEPEPEPDRSTGKSTPFRSRTRETRTSTGTSKSDEEGTRTDVPMNVSSGTQVDKFDNETKALTKAAQSTSIAVQVNLDTETTEESEPVVEIQDSKSIEISTQTEVPEEDTDCPMFYIPLQQGGASGATASSDQQMIQGVALKLDTEGPMGPNQRVIMKAKLVTKPPDVPSIKAVVMPQPKRMFDQKNNNPPIGTVQPTTRKPPEVVPEEPSTDKSTGTSTKPAALEIESVVESEPSSAKPKTPNKAAGKGKEKGKEKAESSDDQSCPSASSSKSKKGSKGKTVEATINPSNSTWLPPGGTPSKLVEAPTFHPTEKDFQDPFEFFDRIRPAAEKFGLCRIVPPSTFKPDCKVSDDMRFTAYNQYVHRMFHRWGPNVKEMMAIKKYLSTQSISLKQPPWIGGIEVDLPRLYQSVQSCGGLMKVMEKKKWNQVADMMRIPKAAQDRVTKLDDIYCKYLLPYDTLSPDERQKLFDEVEKDWSERQGSSTDSQTDDDEDNYIEECEECVVKGRNMGLNQFFRIARNTMSMWFKNTEPSPREVENEFWKHVKERNHHVCVHSGSIDSSGWGYGFPVAKNNSFSKHPWNLKVLTNNCGSVLRSLGPVMGVTVPTLHVGMVFTAFCWYRDPHGLPWIEYLHTGAPKIWYGISDDNSTVFQEVLSKLLPRYIKSKTIWLPSDTAMIPPDLLVDHGVSLCHTVQEPGQFILVFPRAFTSSICTGYLVSESVYFAQPSWLTTAQQVFKDIQESSEPSMFSLEKLLFSIATDSRSSVGVLKQVLPMVWHVRQRETERRKTLLSLGLKSSERLPPKEFVGKKRKGRWTQEEDGDYECEVCRMNLHVSLVTNSHEEGVYCLPHAIDLLTEKRYHTKYCKLMYTYSEEEMNELVEKLEQRIESKSQKKSLGKSTNSK